MKRVAVFIFILAAVLLAGAVWLSVNVISGDIEFESFEEWRQPNQEVIPLVIESSCIDDLQQHSDEVEARINAAVLLERAKHQAAQDDMQRIIDEAVTEAVLGERARWVNKIEVAIGTMKIFEDGVWETPDGEFGCIPYTLCDAENEMLWNPQDLFWPPE